MHWKRKKKKKSEHRFHCLHLEQDQVPSEPANHSCSSAEPLIKQICDLSASPRRARRTGCAVVVQQSRPVQHTVRLWETCPRSDGVSGSPPRPTWGPCNRRALAPDALKPLEIPFRQTLGLPPLGSFLGLRNCSCVVLLKRLALISAADETAKC